MLKLKKIPITDNKNLDSGLIRNDYISSPSLSLNDKQVPEIKDWQVGETYTIVLEIKMVSMSAYDKSGTSGSFDIIKYKVMDDIEDMSDADLEEMQGEALSS